MRNKKIIVTGFDENWEPVKFKLKNLPARCVQHEVDHLDGITIGNGE
jgi:peptide deformylase